MTLPINYPLKTQLTNRIEKLHSVFNWCSSILISITAGVIVASASEDIVIENTGQILISAVIIILTTYAWLWINENLKFESIIRDQIDKNFEVDLNYLQMITLRPDKAKFGYKVVITLLGIVALAATWESIYWKAFQ